MTTEPCSSSNSLAVHRHLHRARPRRRGDAGRTPLDVATRPASSAPAPIVDGGSLAGNVSATASSCAVAVVDAEGLEAAPRNDCFASASGTRSCGRRGPARLGSTVERSSSTTCEYVGLVARVVPERVLLAVRLDQRDALVGPARQAQVRERLVVDGEEAAGRAVLRATCSRSSRGRRAAARPGRGRSTRRTSRRRPSLRRICVTVRTRSVAVAPSGSSPVSWKPTTCGTSIEIASPSIAASASIPPTPQPSTPRPLTIVVCESVPTSVSGNACPSRASTTRARNSRLTWWTMPVFGGTTWKLSNALLAPAQERVALAVALELELGVAEDRARASRTRRPAPSGRSRARPGAAG